LNFERTLVLMHRSSLWMLTEVEGSLWVSPFVARGSEATDATKRRGVATVVT
jgi:hypothetical protein